VTDLLLEYLKKECMIFKVYGFADIKKKGLPSTSKGKNKKNTSGFDNSTGE